MQEILTIQNIYQRRKCRHRIQISVLGVNTLATSATLISGEKKTDSAITLGDISAS